MRGKTVLITGATSGIGYETALALAEMGAGVHFIARDRAKALALQQELILKGGSSRFFLADLSNQKSIYRAVEDVKKELPVIDVLINNAGAVFSPFLLSEDGIEMTMAVNHFSYFLLTIFLLEQVKKSSEGRIVNVASSSNRFGKIDFRSFTEDDNYSEDKAYRQSKLCNVLFTKQLAKKLKDTHVTANCLHPGRARTKITKKRTGFVEKLAWEVFFKIFSVSVKKAAQTTIFLASSQEVKGVSGQYFSKSKISQAYNSLADDIQLQEKLWQKSLELCQFESDIRI